MLDAINDFFQRTLFSPDDETRAACVTDLLTGAIIGVTVFSSLLWNVMG